MDIFHLIRKFLDHLKVSAYSRKTISGYERWLGLFENYFRRHEEVSDIAAFSKDSLYRFAGFVLNRKRSDGKPLSDPTKNQILGSVKNFLTWAHEEGKILEDFSGVLRRRFVNQKIPKNILSERQVRRILETPKAWTRAGFRDRVMLEVLYGTGLRRFELARLEVFDVDFERMLTFIRQGKGRKDRVVPMAGYLKNYLEKYLAKIRPRFVSKNPGENRLFVSTWGRAFSEAGLSAWAERIRQASGEPFTCHKLRHAFATHLLKNGAGMVYIQKLLGHEKIATTEVYTRVYPAELKKIVAEKHPRNLDGSVLENLEMPGKNRKLSPIGKLLQKKMG